MVTVNGNMVIVPLTNVTDVQRIRVALYDVTDGELSGDVVIPLSVLLGDTSGNGNVSASDISRTKSQSGSAVTATNFRTDVNTSGRVTAADITQVKVNAGHALP